MHLYVYYQVAWTDVDATAAKVRALQRSIGLGRVLQRTDRDKPAATFMEIYEGVDADFENVLNRSVEGIGLVTGTRHVERFEDIA